MWLIEQIQTSQHFEACREGIARLLERYHTTLMDVSCGDDPTILVENLSQSLPLLWVLIRQNKRDVFSQQQNSTESWDLPRQVESEQQVYGLVSLTDIIINRHAFLHGVSHPDVRQNPLTYPLIAQTALAAMTYAFEHLSVLKVKAEFEADNLGAKGFCLRMGFRKEGHFKQDNRVNGNLKDVLVYSLPYERFKVLFKEVGRSAIGSDPCLLQGRDEY